MFKFILLTMLDDSPVVLNVANIDFVQPVLDNPEYSKIVDLDGNATHVKEEVKLVYEYIQEK